MNIRRVFTILIILSTILFSQGWVQLGSNINGEAAGDKSGHSVALSTDGTRVAIGAFNNDGNGADAGHVRVYSLTGGVWTQVGADIDGDAAGANFGHTVALSSDGTRLAVGAPFYAGSSFAEGYVKVFSESGGVWTQIFSYFGPAHNYTVGSSVSLSSDGKTFAFGCRQQNITKIFSESGGIWTQMGSDITGGNNSGQSVSLSADGTRVVIGDSVFPGDFTGRAQIFDWNGTAWTQVGSDLNGDAASNNFGDMVSISADGTRVASIAESRNYTRVYELIAGVWTQIGTDLDIPSPLDDSISLSPNGTVIAITGSGFASKGNTVVYSESGGVWTQISCEINGNNGDFYDEYSYFHQVSTSNGTRVAIGYGNNDGNGVDSGTTRIYELSSTAPDINLKQGSTSIADGGNYNFGSQSNCSTTDVVFTIENTGLGNDLILTTPITIGGTNASDFSIQAQPTSPVASSGNTTFTVRFNPTSSGSKTATIDIGNNVICDDKNPYTIYLNGSSTIAISTVIVSGAGTATVNGTYTETGTHNGESYYTQTGGGTTHYIYKNIWWVIGPSLNGPFVDGLYINSSNLISNSWMVNPFVAGAVLPAPTTTDVPAPEINLKQGMTDIANPGSHDFGNKVSGTDTDIVFTIENTGAADLTLTTLSLGGADATDFSIQAQPTSPVPPCGTTSFTVRFTPTSDGSKTATIDIANNDGDENPYNLTLNGTSSNSDYGDAPASYGSAGHTVDTDIRLGASVNADGGDYGSGDASGDTDDGVVSFETWENGTVIGPGYLPDGSTGSVTMDDDTYAVLVQATNNTGTAAQLVGWIDWNRNDVFDDPAERSVTVLDGSTGNVPTGSNNVDVVVYWDGQTQNGTTSFARFRITTDASFKSPTSPSPTGNAGDGEVEDYQIPDDVLPVELSSFTIENTIEGILSKWTTESEIENLGFLLERKTDGSVWKEIVSYKSDNSLLGQGTTSSPTNYDYLDKLVVPNTTYDYRLADVDYDGVVTYHSVRTVKVDKTLLSSKIDKFTVLPAYPNPFNPSTTITYGLDKDSEVSIQIYDITGQLVNTLLNTEQKQGWHSVIWNGTNKQGTQVPAGIYLSKITSNDQTKTVKLMLLK